jgi:hypothetical protein
VLAIAIMFRKEVKDLLAKMKSLKAPGGIEAAFIEKVEAVSIESKRVEAPLAPEAKSAQPIPTAEKQHPRREVHELTEWRRRHEESVARVMGERPVAMVLDAWNQVESLIRDLVVASDTGCGVHSAENAIMKLVEIPWGVIDKPTAEVLLNLLALRNQVAHVEFEPDKTAARDYVRSAQRMVKHLEGLLADLAENVKIASSVDSP